MKLQSQLEDFSVPLLNLLMKFESHFPSVGFCVDQNTPWDFQTNHFQTSTDNEYFSFQVIYHRRCGDSTISVHAINTTIEKLKKYVFAGNLYFYLIFFIIFI